MSAHILLLGGSVVSRAPGLARTVAVNPAFAGHRVRILDARDFARLPSIETGQPPQGAPQGDRNLAALENPQTYDPATYAQAATAAASDCDLLILLAGPLFADPSILGLAQTKVFVDLEERLLLLRWADALMEAGSPGGIEALQLYGSEVEPSYAAWSARASAAAGLVLDDEDGPELLVQKLLWFLRGPVGTPDVRQAATETASGASARIPDAERLALIRRMESRYTRPASPMRGIGASWRTFTAYKLYPALKRAIDVLLVSVLLAIIWPVFALVAFLIWLDDPGPVFYSQTRVGQYGKGFPFPKFRSMVRNADKLKDKLLAMNEMSGGVTFKMKRDPRIIPIGFVIRKYSLDELPQLWSILRGHLSLVGPRPPVPREVALYTASDRRRLEAVPGLTCIWQVSGRSDIPFPRQVELDVEYLESRNLLLDLRLLIATIPAVLTGKGAY